MDECWKLQEKPILWMTEILWVAKSQKILNALSTGDARVLNSIRLMEEILHQVDMVNIPLFTGFHTCWVVVWDFFHQQYCSEGEVLGL